MACGNPLAIWRLRTRCAGDWHLQRCRIPSSFIQLGLLLLDSASGRYVTGKILEIRQKTTRYFALLYASFEAIGALLDKDMWRSWDLKYGLPADPPPAGETWVDAGATVTQLVADGVYQVSIPLVGVLMAGQTIRLGTAETVFTAFWSGFGVINYFPHRRRKRDKVWRGHDRNQIDQPDLPIIQQWSPACIGPWRAPSLEVSRRAISSGNGRPGHRRDLADDQQRQADKAGEPDGGSAHVEYARYVLGAAPGGKTTPLAADC